MIPIFFLAKGGYGLMAMVWTDLVSVVYKQGSPKKLSFSQGQRSTTLKSCFKCFQVLSTNNSTFLEFSRKVFKYLSELDIGFSSIS